jgi:hypothetical protein
MDGQPMIEIERPRSVFEVLEATIALYRRFPWLFLALAAAVVVPYELIILVSTGAGPQTQGNAGPGAGLLFTALETFLVSPLISALHVHGVLDVRDGKEPEIAAIGRRALPVLPVVSAAVIVSFFGTIAGFVALIVPGVLLFLRWSVVAQVAAIEKGGWSDALKRSRQLTRTHYLHILGLLLLTGLIVGVPGTLLGLPFRHSSTTVPSFVIGTALDVVFASFTALATAILYFDLRARLAETERSGSAAEGPASAEPEAVTISGRTVEPTGHPLDPDSYSDEDRPAGWYVEPDSPWRMRYWSADGKSGWSKRTTRTPKKTLAGWYKVKGP